MNSETVLGIDFGTTNSVCAVLSGGDPEVLENAEGDRITPSVVYYTKEHEQNRPLIGQQAINKAEDNPERVISSIKRKMGDDDYIEVDDEQYRVEEVAAEIIRKLRSDAATKLGVDRSELTSAVITTPAYWESDRKQAVIQAAELAGFDSVRTIKEPASAAIAYGRFEPGLNKTVGVYDLGGGTFDFALVDVNVGGDTASGEEYDVVAQSGDPELGGDDWDQRIVDWIVSNFEEETGVNPLEPHYSDESPYAHKIREERIRSNAREAKEELSNRATTDVDIRIPFLMEIGGESLDIDTELSQAKFESMTDDLLEATVDPIFTALDDAGMKVHQVDEVVLVGGSTRMPQVKELVKSVFQQEPKQRVNVDEAVAAGAAIKANRDDILLLEVTPLSLGIGIKGDRFKRMIHRNERLPARTTEVFTTSNEGATAVRIPIYQGERDIASENRHLKTLIIQGMTPGSRHSAHIEVTFEVQQNGLINVQAVENTRNKSVNVEIEGENRLPGDYIQERIEEAREMEEMDRRRQKVIEAQNEARQALKESERLLNEFPHVFKEDEDEHVKKHIANVRQVRSDNTATLGELRQATEDLNEWVLEIGDRVRRTGARVQTGPKQGPDTEPADVPTGDSSGSVQTDGPGQTVMNAGDENDDLFEFGDDDLEEVSTVDETSDSADDTGSFETESGSAAAPHDFDTDFSTDEPASSSSSESETEGQADSDATSDAAEKPVSGPTDGAERIEDDVVDDPATESGGTGSPDDSDPGESESSDAGASGGESSDQPIVPDDARDDDPRFPDRAGESQGEQTSGGVQLPTVPDDDDELVDEGAGTSALNDAAKDAVDGDDDDLRTGADSFGGSEPATEEDNATKGAESGGETEDEDVTESDTRDDRTLPGDTTKDSDVEEEGDDRPELGGPPESIHADAPRSSEDDADDEDEEDDGGEQVGLDDIGLE